MPVGGFHPQVIGAFGVSGPRTTRDGTLYLAGTSRVILNAADRAPPGGLPSGLDRRFYSLDGGDAAVFTTGLAPGGGAQLRSSAGTAAMRHSRMEPSE